MADDQAPDFFKNQYFAQLNQSIAEIKEAQEDMKKDISDIKSKVIYMYGFAAAIGIVASFFIDWLRTFLMGIAH